MRLTTPPLIAVAAISLAALAAITAFAQTSAPVTLSGLFDPGLSDVKTTEQLKDAIKKSHRECYPPRVKFTVVSSGAGLPPSSDPSYVVEVLAPARAYALAAALPSLGLEPDQFKVDSVIGVVDGVLVSYDKFNDDDKDPPKLKVTSIPKKGTKVKAGDKIKVTIKASERYEDGHKSWPSGVFNIQLTADDGLVDSKNYGRVPDPCERRTFEATYTVPRNPPLIVHLTAIAEDAVGNKDSEVGEFPTGDVWKGTMHTDAQASFDPGRANAYSCSSAFDATLRLIIARGEISGDGRAVYASSTCREGVYPRCAAIPFKLQGRAYSDRLEIHFVFTELVPPKCVNWGFASAYFMGQTVTIPITAPGVAEGQSTSSYNPDAVSHYNTRDTIHLKCETCATQ